MQLDVRFGYVEIHNLEELGKIIYLYPDMAYSLLLREDFQNRLKEEEPYLYPTFLALLKEKKDEVFLFKVSYLFCPYMTFRYQGREFASYQELGTQILRMGPQIDIYLRDILEEKLLSFVMKLQKDDERHPKLYELVLQKEKEFLDQPNYAYFSLGFHLSESKVLVYHGKPYVDPEFFFVDILKPETKEEFFATFEDNQYIFAWLNYLGYDKLINRYHTLVNLIEEKEKNGNVSTKQLSTLDEFPHRK